MSVTEQEHSAERPNINGLPEERLRLVLAVALLLLGFLLSFFLLQDAAWWIVFVIIPMVVIAAYYLIGKTFREWLIEHVIVLAAVSLTAVLVVALILWGVVNFFWTNQDTKTIIGLVFDSGQGQTTTISYPQSILADGRPVNLQLVSINEALITRTLTFSIERPVGVIFIDEPAQQEIRFSAAIGGQERITETIRMANAQTTGGWRHSQTLTIQTEMPISVGVKTDSFEGHAIVEGEQGYNIRNFVNRTINQAGPLIILVTLLIPGLSALLQQEVRKRTENLRAERSQEAKQLNGQFRSHIVSRDFKEAARILDLLRTSRFKEFVYEEIALDEKILELASLSKNSVGCVERTRSWPDGCVIAYLEARHHLQNLWPYFDRVAAITDIPKNINGDQDRYQKALEKLTDLLEQSIATGPWAKDYLRALDALKGQLSNEVVNSGNVKAAVEDVDSAAKGVRNILGEITKSLDNAHYLLPSDSVEQTYLLDRLAQLEAVGNVQKGSGPYLQPTNWPNYEEATAARRFSRTPAELSRPFMHDQAEYEIAELFINEKAFWPKHPLYQQLLKSDDTDHSCAITGTPGCGRTALGFALRFTLKDALMVFISDETSPKEIRKRFVKSLFRYAQLHPTHLGRLTNTELYLMALLISSEFSTPLIRALVKQAQKNVFDEEWLKQEGEPEEVNLWRENALTQLQRFERVISEIGSGPTGQVQHVFGDNSAVTGVSEIKTCASALGLKRVLLVVDTKESNYDWVGNKILPAIPQLHSDGVYTILLLLEEMLEYLPTDYSSIQVKQLKWTERDFGELLEFRYKQQISNRGKLIQRFKSEELLHLMIRLSRKRDGPNPRVFFQIWQALMKELGSDEILIDERAIKRAAQTTESM